jgi:carboxypeptidase Q
VSRVPVLATLAVLIVGAAATPLHGQSIADEYRDAADRLIDAATANHDAYARVTELVDRFGARVSGSVALENAIDWIIQVMESDGATR